MNSAFQSNVYHPKPGDKGQKIRITEPSTSTPLDEFADPYMVATVVPGGPVPDELHGVQFAPWTDHPTTDDEWAVSGCQNALISGGVSWR